eukprot:6480431-Amphidinium_carterae.1
MAAGGRNPHAGICQSSRPGALPLGYSWMSRMTSASQMGGPGSRPSESQSMSSVCSPQMSHQGWAMSVIALRAFSGSSTPTAGRCTAVPFTSL